MSRGAPGQRRGRKGREEQRGRKSKAAVVWQPAELEEAREVKHARNVKIVERVLEDARVKSGGGLQTLADELLAALDRRDYYAELTIKRDLTADEGRAAGSNAGHVQKLLSKLGVVELRDEDDCPACNGTGRQNGSQCVVCGGTGEAPL